MDSLYEQPVNKLPNLDELVDFDIKINNESPMVGWLKKPDRMALKIALEQLAKELEIHINEVLDAYGINRGAYYNYIDCAGEADVLEPDTPQVERTYRKYSDTSKLTPAEKRKLFKLVEEMRLTGTLIPVACRQVGITENAYRRWRDDPSCFEDIDSSSLSKRRLAGNRKYRIIDSAQEQKMVVESVALLVRSKMSSVQNACVALLVSYEDYRTWKNTEGIEPVFPIKKGRIAKPKSAELTIPPANIDRLMLATEYIEEQTDFTRQELLTAIGYSNDTQARWDRIYSALETIPINEKVDITKVQTIAAAIDVSRNELLHWMHDFSLVADDFFEEHYSPETATKPVKKVLRKKQKRNGATRVAVAKTRKSPYRVIESAEEQATVCEAIHLLVRAGICTSTDAKRTLGVRIEDYRAWNTFAQPVFAITAGRNKPPAFIERTMLSPEQLVRIEKIARYIEQHTSYTANDVLPGLGFKSKEYETWSIIQSELEAITQSSPDTVSVSEVAENIGVTQKILAPWLFHYGLINTAEYTEIMERAEVVLVKDMIHGSAAKHTYSMDRLLSEGIEYMPAKEFLDTTKHDEIRNPLPHESFAELVPNNAFGSNERQDIAYIEPIAQWPQSILSVVEPMSKEQEQHQFRRYNFLKYEAAQLLAAYKLADSDENKAAIEQQLIAHLRAADTVRAEIVRFNVRLVHSIVNRETKRPSNDTDELGDANTTLLRAVDKFDFTRGFKFSTYATHSIQRDLWRNLGRKAKRNKRTVSLDGAFDYGLTSTFSDFKAMEEDEYTNLKQNLREAISEVLDDRENSIIILRYGLGDEEPLTLGDVGNKIGVTKERIRQLQVRAEQKIKTYLEEFLPDFAAIFAAEQAIATR